MAFLSMYALIAPCPLIAALASSPTGVCLLGSVLVKRSLCG